MEPEGMNPPDDAWLESLLQEGLREPPLPDNGFTVRVLDVLPSRSMPDPRPYLTMAWIFAFAGLAEGLDAAGAFSRMSAAWTGLLQSSSRLFSDPWMDLVWLAVAASILVAWKPVKSVFEG